MRGKILFLLVALSAVVANAQYTIEVTVIPVIDGYTNPVVIGGRYVVAGENSVPVEKLGAYVSLGKPAEARLVDIVAEQAGTFEEAELASVPMGDGSLKYLFAGEGRWRVTAFFENPSGIVRKTIDLAPPAPKLVASTAIAEITGSVGADTKKVAPVSATGGRGAYRYSIQPSVPLGMDFNGATGEVAGSPRLAASSVHLVTVSDESGQKASASFKLTINDKPPPLVVPDDNFDNLGRRVAGWTAGLPKRKELADIYTEAARQLEKDAGATLGSVGAFILDARGKLLNADDLVKYSVFLDETKKEAIKRNPMPTAVAIDFYKILAVGLGAK